MPGNNESSNFSDSHQGAPETTDATADTFHYWTPSGRPRPISWSNWAPVDRAVLCFIRSDGKLLLIRKKRGLGAGKINGPGGRIEPGESAEQAAVRETEEEVGLTPAGLKKMGELSFQFADGYSLHCVVFFASRFSGTLEETEEADPFWCEESEIPYDSMWDDDRLWLSRALNGDTVSGYFSFDGDTMLNHSVTTTSFDTKK